MDSSFSLLSFDLGVKQKRPKQTLLLSSSRDPVYVNPFIEAGIAPEKESSPEGDMWKS